MNTMLLKLFMKFQDLISREEGQDLVEYALVVSLIALGATASMKTLATGISAAFTSISTQLSKTPSEKATVRSLLGESDSYTASSIRRNFSGRREVFA
jgi:pilus assembly protein Flp/PilA